MPVAGGGATVTREIRWLITARDMSRVGLNSAIIALEQLGMAAHRTNFRMMLAGTGMVVASGLIVKGLLGTVEAAKDFDEGLHNIQAISRELTNEDLVLMGDELLDLSMKYGSTASTLTDAMYMIYSAEYEGADATNILETSLMGARAGLTDVETAATSLITILKGYNLSVDEATRVMDMMFNAVDVGIFKYEQLAGSFGKIVSSAYQLHIPLEEVLTAYVMMSRRGMDLNNAQTYLNRAMVSFLKPSKDMTEWLNRMGYESGQAYLATRGLGGMIEDLRNQFQMTNLVVPDAIMQTEDYNEVLGWMKENHIANAESLAALFPRIQGLRAVLALVSAPANEWNDTLTKIAANTGTTMAALEKQQQSYAYQLDVFKATIEVLKIKIGQALIPELINMLQSWQKTIAGIMETHPDIGKTIAEIGKISAAVLGVSGVFLILKSTTGSAFKSIWGMALGLWNFMGPWSIGLGLVIAAVATNWEDFSDVIMDLKDIATDVFRSLVNAIKPFIEAMADLLRWLDDLGVLVPIVLAFFGAWVGIKVLAPMVVGLAGAIMKLGVAMYAHLAPATAAMTTSVAASGTAMTGGAVASSTLGSSFASMAPAIGIASMAIGGLAMLVYGFISSSNQAWKEVVEFRNKLSDQAQEIVKNTLPALGELRNKLKEVESTGGDTKDIIKQINDELLNIAQIVPQAVEGYDILTGAWDINNEEALKGLTNLALTGAAMQIINQRIADGANKWIELGNASGVVTSAFEDFTGIGDRLQDSITEVGAKFFNTGQIISAMGVDSAKGIKEFDAQLNYAYRTMMGWTEEGQNMSVSQREELTKQVMALMELRDEYADFAAEHGMKTEEVMSNMTNLTEVWNEHINAMLEESRTAGAELKEIPQTIIDAYMSGVPEFKTAAVVSIGSYFTGMFQTWGIESSKVGPAVTELIEMFGNEDLSSQQGRDNIMTFIDKMIESLGLNTEQADTLRTTIAELIGLMAPENHTPTITIWGHELGSTFGHSIEQGIQPTITTLGNTITRLFKTIFELARLAAGVQSPSKKMMEIGEMMSEGLAMGLENGLDRINVASWDLAHAAMSPINIGAGNAPVGNSVNNSRSNDNRVSHNTIYVQMPEGTDGHQLVREMRLEIGRL
jgi:TP901 family phage tail tape measure protein